MKRIGAYRVYIMYCIVGISLCLLCRTGCIWMQRVDTYDVAIEGYLSDHIRAESVSYINKQWPILHKDALRSKKYNWWPASYTLFEQLSTHTKQQFPWIQSIDLSFFSSGRAHVALIAYDPLCLINNTYVMISTGALLSKDFFEATSINMLRSLSVVFGTEEAVLSDECKRFIVDVPLAVLDAYRCVWVDNNSVRLYDKQQPYFVIVCHPEGIPNDTIMRHCNALKQELIERCVFGVPRAKTWVADIRFEGQIIVSQENRGNIYGTTI